MDELQKLTYGFYKEYSLLLLSSIFISILSSVIETIIVPKLLSNIFNNINDIIKKVIENEKEMINKEKSKFNLHVILYKQEEASSRKKLELYKDKIDKEKTQLLIDKHKLRYEENLFFQKLKDSPVPAHFIQEYEELVIHNNSECKICYEKYEKKTDEEEGRYICIINNCFHKCCNICVNEILKKEKQECPFCRENIISII